MQRVRTLFSVYVFHHILYSLPLRAILSAVYESIHEFCEIYSHARTVRVCANAAACLRARAVQHWEKSQTHAALENAVQLDEFVFVRGEKKKKPFQVLS